MGVEMFVCGWKCVDDEVVCVFGVLWSVMVMYVMLMEMLVCVVCVSVV